MNTQKTIKEINSWYSKVEFKNEIAELIEVAVCSETAKNWSEQKKQDALFLKKLLCKLANEVLTD